MVEDNEGEQIHGYFNAARLATHAFLLSASDSTSSVEGVIDFAANIKAARFVFPTGPSDVKAALASKSRKSDRDGKLDDAAFLPIVCSG